MAKATKILLTTVIISIIGLISSINPSLSHSGHNKSPKTEDKQKLTKEQKSPLSREMHEDIQMPDQVSNYV